MVLQPETSEAAANDTDGTAGSIYCNSSEAALGSAVSKIDRLPCSSVTVWTCSRTLVNLYSKLKRSLQTSTFVLSLVQEAAHQEEYQYFRCL